MASFGRFGGTRESAEGSGFFNWFMLEPVEAEGPVPNRRVAHYRPNGPSFHALAEFLITTDETDRLLALELRLAREFVEHPHNGLFARDIAKSLLRDGLVETDSAALADLANEIEFPRRVETTVLTGRRIDVELPAVPSRGYQVFLGRRGRYDQRCPSVDLVLENYARDGAPWFRTALSSR
jgi:hypothetical protein